MLVQETGARPPPSKAHGSWTKVKSCGCLNDYLFYGPNVASGYSAPGNPFQTIKISKMIGSRQIECERMYLQTKFVKPTI